jgi:acyl-CoA synthetase (AMP-forming)/AMP-acid ligase II
MVTSGRKTSLPIIKKVEPKLMVGCGSAMPGQRVMIVDPDSLTELKDGQVGEIWVSGPSVAKGYWNRPDETDKIFNAYLSDSGAGPFLRTEDLGFIGPYQGPHHHPRPESLSAGHRVDCRTLSRGAQARLRRGLHCRRRR